MQKQGSSLSVSGVLDPTIPSDLSEQTQRRRIVDAMVECCAEKTYAATTIADIVKRASISRTTFYKRFPNKRACFDGALDHCIETLRLAAASARAPMDTPAEAVRKAAAATLGLMATRPALAQLVMGDAITVEPAIVERYRKLIIPAMEGLWQGTDKSQRPYTDPRLAFGRVQVLIFSQIAAKRTAQLPELLPEIVYIGLLPFTGHEEASSQAQVASESAGLGGPAPQ
jgi:AcrR family transcriptional regulator